MKRTKVIVGCSFVVLAAAAVGQLMLDTPQKTAQQPNPQPQTQQAAAPVESLTPPC